MLELIVEELCRLFSQALPEHTIYDKGLVPQNFSRPALCIVSGKTSHKPLNLRLTKHSTEFTLYCFPPLSDMGDKPETVDLHELQNTLKVISDIFRSGFIRAGNRAVKTEGDVVSDCSLTDGYVEVTLCYTDSVEEQAVQKMQNINMRNSYQKGDN